MLQQIQEQRLVQRPDLRLLMTNTLLQMTALELEQRIEQELLENPALELAEEVVCAACQTVITGDVCPNCGQRAEQERPDLSGSPQELLGALARARAGDEDYDDPAYNIATPFTLQDHLRWQAQLELSAEEWAIAHYLIDCLNDDGYLEGPLTDIAARVGRAVAEVERVLKMLQTFEPVGVGASNLQEALLIQLRELREQERERHGVRSLLDLAERIIRDHLEDLGHHRYPRIAHKLGVPLLEVTEAVAFIVKHLSPYPGRQFRPPWNVPGSEEHQLAKPEVIIQRVEDANSGEFGYEVEIVQSKESLLRVNQFYRDLQREMQRNKSRYTLTERQHVAHCVKRAELFLEHLNRRQQTLHLITTTLIECQRGFFDHDGDRARLKPLTKTHLADLVGRDVSTVSRATSNKYMQIPPYGAVVAFDIFFETAPDAKDYLQQLIAQEDPAHPLSDQEIAEKLRAAGFDVARRTVAKYRGMLKIPSTLGRRSQRISVTD